MLVLLGEAGDMRVALAPSTRLPPRATMILLPGRAEFIEKHGDTVADLRRLGFAAAVVEWRGQGLSGRREPWRHRGHIDDFGDYLDDLDNALRRLEKLQAPRPWLM